MRYKIKRMEQKDNNYFEVDIQPLTGEEAFGQVIALRVSGIILQRTMFDIKREIDDWLFSHDKHIRKKLKAITEDIKGVIAVGKAEKTG